jgi:hypothetical protein
MVVAEQVSAFDDFFDNLEHDRKADILALRKLILDAVPGLSETLNGKAPGFARGDAERIAMRLQPGNRVQLILHRGTKAGADDLFRFEDPDKLIAWAAPDRGVITIRDSADLTEKASAIGEVLKRWVAMTTR